MGYDCSCYLSENSRINEVREFLKFLGYNEVRKGIFVYFEDKDYLSTSGVSAHISQGDKNQIIVYLRAQIFASLTDINQFNLTAKQLRKRFGGYFTSDFGKNRYICYYSSDRKYAEGGCYLAYQNFNENLQVARLYVNTARFDIKLPPIGEYRQLDAINPLIISNNILVPFLVSIIEEYYRSSYIALLKYSDRKHSIFKNARIHPDDLLRVSNQMASIEEAVSQSKSFQNMDNIAANFREVDHKIDIYGVLTRPYRKRKESLYNSIDNLFNQRHLLIHRNAIFSDYTREKLERDMANVKVSIQRTYSHFVDTYNWDPSETKY